MNAAVEHAPQSLANNNAVVMVPDVARIEFNKRLAKLNAKAARFGLPPIEVVNIVQARFAQIAERGDRGTNYTLRRLRPGAEAPVGAGVVLMHEIELQYPVIKLGHWRVVAQMEATDTGTLLFIVSDDADDRGQSRLERPMLCEHCNAVRTRRLTYLLRDTRSPDYKQVGSTCLEDFTGIEPSRALFLAKMSVFIREIEDLCQYGAQSPDRIQTLDYLARVLFLTETEGFVSIRKARETDALSTASQALYLQDRFQKEPDLERLFSARVADIRLEAAQVVAWFTDREHADSFEANIRTLLLAEDIKLDMKHLAFAAAAVPCYRRARAAAQLADRKAASRHVGIVGTTLEVTLSVHQVVTFETQFGLQKRINMTDSEGNRLSWKTGSAPSELADNAALGRTFLAKLKVKAHDEYRGTQVTEVSHVKFKGWATSTTELAHAA